jgi:fibronectin type 3 domain-containing protein
MAWALKNIFLLAPILYGCGSSVDQPAVDDSDVFSIAETSVVSYDTELIVLNIKGKSDLETLKPDSFIEIHKNSICSDVPLVVGQFEKFQNNGLEVEIPYGVETTLYIGTTASTKCFILEKLTPALPDLMSPTISASEPASPSRISTSPILTGAKPAHSIQLQFFLDQECTAVAGAGHANDFSSIGIGITAIANATNEIYATAQDLLGRSSPCSLAGSYIHNDTAPDPATFLSTAPTSPNNTSITPNFIGSVSENVTWIEFYDDIACSNIVAQGAPEDFSSSGITIEVGYHSSTSIWAKTFDEPGNSSTCNFLTTYIHDISPPAAPVFIEALPNSPTGSTLLPRIRGTSSSDTATIRFYPDFICSQTIGLGNKSTFEGAGIQVNVQPDQSTSIYAKSFDFANNGSTCTLFTEYVSDLTPPDPPSFTITDPVSPNNSSINPKVIGNTSFDTTTVFIYQDEACTNLLASGPAATYSESGISVSVSANAETLFYGRASDNVGNLSECVFLGLYAHSNVAPPNPTFLSSSPASPSRTITTPYIRGNADPSISTIEFYLEDTCDTQVSSGSRFAFVNVGISVPVYDNTDNIIYVKAVDKYGNTTACLEFTNFIHTDRTPLAPAFDSFDPNPPNNITTTPLVFGTANNNILSVLPTSKIAFYDNSLCFNKIGEDVIENFRIPAATGVQISTPANSTTSIYAKAFDDADNESACTFMSDYTHNIIPPGQPSFVSASPASPSYSRPTYVKGTIASSTSPLPVEAVDIFSDSGCTNLLTTGTPSVFLSSGILISAPANTTSAIHAQTRDSIGNKSTCRLMINFKHDDEGPEGLQSILLSNGTVRLIWFSDSDANPTPRYTVKRSTKSGGPYTTLATDILSPFFNDSQVKSAKRYYYVVNAYNSTGESKNSPEIFVNVTAQNPIAPTGLVATPGSNQITLTWVQNGTALSYSVLRSNKPGGPYTLLATTTLPTYTNMGLTNGTPYYYKLRTNNTNGQSSLSEEVSAVPRPFLPTPVNLTAVPRYNAGECGGSNGVLLRWTPPSYYHSFIINRGTSVLNTSQIGTTNNTYFVDCDISNYQETRYYTVSSVWGASNGGESTPAIFYAMGAPFLSINAGNSHTNLSWTHGTDSDQYKIYRSTVGLSPRTLLATTSNKSYTDNTVINGNTYTYQVEPIAIPVGSGWLSNTVSASPEANPNAPEQLSLEIDFFGKAILRWKAPTHFNRFRIYRATNSAGPYTFLANANQATYTDNSPAPGPNFYRVSALWGSHETDQSPFIGFRNSKVIGLSATADADSINLNWTNQASAIQYNIYRSTTSTSIGTLIASPTVNTFDDDSVASATGYYYTVISDYGDGLKNVPSDVVSGVPNSIIPSGLTVTATTANSISLEWTSQAATRYYGYVATSPGGPWTQKFNTISKKGLMTGLIANTDYYVSVSALVSGTETLKSAPVLTRTVSPPSAPSLVAYSGRVALSWLSLTGVNDYSVLRSEDGATYTTVASGLGTLSYDDMSVVNGTQYTYKIQYHFDNIIVNSSTSAQVIPGHTPDYPKGLYVNSNVTGTSFDLNWQEVNNRTSFNIYWSNTSGSGFTLFGNTLSSSGNTIGGLTQGSTYYFRVTSLNGTLESAQSPEFAAVATTVPPAPAVAISASGNVNVTWSTVTGAASYDLHRAEDGGSHFSQLATGIVTTSFEDTTVVDEKVYQYRFLPRNSNAVMMNFSGISESINTGAEPLAPADLIAFLDQPASQVRLVWVNSPTAVSYRIYRSNASGGPYTSLSTVPSTSTEYTDTTLVSGQTYYYIVRAINSVGSESPDSNEVGVSLVDAPSTLSATASNMSIGLSWTSVASAASYRVLRSEVSGGPYLVLAEGLITNSYSDTNIVHDKTYYYVVNALYASGAISENSPEANATSIKTMNLVVPVELLDRPIGSNTTDTTFSRTRTSHDPSAYDGSVSVELEVVATNFDASPREIRIIDSLNSVVDTIEVPAITNSKTRLSKIITLSVSADEYRLELEGTTSAEQLNVYTARLKIIQTGATKTKIYIPLLSSDSGTASGDLAAPVFSNNSTGYLFPNSILPFVKNTSHYSQLAQILPWELEAVIAADANTSGTLSLYNTNKSLVVSRSETIFSVATPTLINVPMENNSTNFSAADEGNTFKLALRCRTNCGGAETVHLYKANLWLSLENLTKLRIFQRLSLGEHGFNGVEIYNSGRTNFNASLFSNPLVYFQALVTSTTNFDLSLAQQSTSDFDNSSTALIGSSTLNFSSGTSLQTSGVITIPDDSRLIIESNATNGAHTIHQSNLVLDLTN